jgi:hypothetical protein
LDCRDPAIHAEFGVGRVEENARYGRDRSEIKADACMPAFGGHFRDLSAFLSNSTEAERTSISGQLAAH